jgi:hypothetical protein
LAQHGFGGQLIRRVHKYPQQKSFQQGFSLGNEEDIDPENEDEVAKDGGDGVHGQNRPLYKLNLSVKEGFHDEADNDGIEAHEDKRSRQQHFDITGTHI